MPAVDPDTAGVRNKFFIYWNAVDGAAGPSAVCWHKRWSTETCRCKKQSHSQIEPEPGTTKKPKSEPTQNRYQKSTKGTKAANRKQSQEASQIKQKIAECRSGYESQERTAT